MSALNEKDLDIDASEDPLDSSFDKFLAEERHIVSDSTFLHRYTTGLDK